MLPSIPTAPHRRGRPTGIANAGRSRRPRTHTCGATERRAAVALAAPDGRLNPATRGLWSTHSRPGRRPQRRRLVGEAAASPPNPAGPIALPQSPAKCGNCLDQDNN